MKLNLLVAIVTIVLAGIILTSGVVFGSNDYFLKPDPVVDFPDENLEKVVRQHIRKPEGTIHASNLQHMEFLLAQDSGIEDLTSLEYCTGLRIIGMSLEKITDFTPVCHIKSLESISLGFNEITAIPSPTSPLLPAARA